MGILRSSTSARASSAILALVLSNGCGSSNKEAATGGAGAHSSGGSGGGATDGGGGGRAQGGSSSTPTACSGLKPGGQWESIQPPGVLGATSIVVDPFDPATVWACADGLWKSPDCGATWSKVNTGLHGDEIGKGANWSIVIDPVDRGTIYLVGAYGALGLWKSTTGGQDFEQIFSKDTEFAKVAQFNFVNNVSMEANNHLHLIVMVHGTCVGFDTSCEAETTDGGATWKLTATPKAWGEGGGVMLLNATSWLWGGSGAATGTWLTTDNGHSFKQVAEGYSAHGEFTIRPLDPASDKAYYISSLQGVLRSTDGLTWSPVSKDRIVGLAIGDTALFGMDQWSLNFRVAQLSDPMTWLTMPPPSGLKSNEGCPYLDYDKVHHVLYASCFDGGVWRLATTGAAASP